MATANGTTNSLDLVKRAHRAFGFTYRAIAEVIAADESSLHRWRCGDARPSAVFRRQIAALGRCLDLMERAFGHWEAARVWLGTRCLGLDSARPVQVFLVGEIDLLTPPLLAPESDTQGQRS